jgi:tRNA nucleotidyltransferase/poly(A) polymerase
MYYVYNSKNITKYPFKYEDDKTDEIYIPKIQTTLTDLIKILFDVEYPWLDIKYEKRLYRLLLLTFVQELSKSDVYKIEKILKSKKKRQPTSEEDITFETLNYRNDNLKKKSKAEQNSKYKEYISKYNNIVKRLLKVIAQIKDFIESKKQFQSKDIYEFSFDPFGEQ